MQRAGGLSSSSGRWWLSSCSVPGDCRHPADGGGSRHPARGGASHHPAGGRGFQHAACGRSVVIQLVVVAPVIQRARGFSSLQIAGRTPVVEFVDREPGRSLAGPGPACRAGSGPRRRGAAGLASLGTREGRDRSTASLRPGGGRPALAVGRTETVMGRSPVAAGCSGGLGRSAVDVVPRAKPWPVTLRAAVAVGPRAAMAVGPRAALVVRMWPLGAAAEIGAGVVRWALRQSRGRPTVICCSGAVVVESGTPAGREERACGLRHSPSGTRPPQPGHETAPSCPAGWSGLLRSKSFPYTASMDRKPRPW